MLTMPETNSNLATLEKKVDLGFARLDGEFKRVDEHFKRVDQHFKHVDERADRSEATMKEGFDRMDAKFDALYRLIIQVGGGLIGTLIAAIIAILIAHM